MTGLRAGEPDWDACVVPVALPVRICAAEGCGKKLALLNKGDRCFVCQQREHARVLAARSMYAAPGLAFCERGCGKPRHRGECAGAQKPRPTFDAGDGRRIDTRSRWMFDPGRGPCPHGCGRLKHPGRCAAARGAVPQTASARAEAFVEATAAAAAEEVVKAMDGLISSTVRRDQIPRSAQPVRKAKGRLGELWAKLQQLAPDLAERVENRDNAHANSTVTHLRAKARKAGKVLGVARDGSTAYVWLENAPARGESLR